MAASPARIPILRPKLPTADRIAPYLRAIDASRFYSNFGPLVVSLEERLADHYGLGTGTVTTVANATAGIALALAAQGAPPGTLCAMPAWTFVASAHAAVNARLVPYFIDVDPETWALDPTAVGDEIARAPSPVGAVMVVAPYGRPVDTAEWDRFRARTALPVVIDAAAGFDSLVPAEIPAVVSLHATKVLGTGEGGFVASKDREIVHAVRRRSNFGFNADRQAVVPATNAKLSEYHAAVGLAALDEWAETRAEWMNVAAAYKRAFGRSNEIRLQEAFGEGWIGATCVVAMRDSSTRAEAALSAAGIETRRWWGDGAHANPATATFPRTALPATEALAGSTLALPFYRDLASAEIDRIAGIVLQNTAA